MGDGMKVGALILLSVIALIECIYIFQNKKRWTLLLLFMCSGPAAMLMVNLLSQWTGINIPVNGYSVFASITLGIPGDICLWVINSLMMV